MTYNEPALFMIYTHRSYPFLSDPGAYDKHRMYGRRLVNVTYSDEDASLLSYEYGGETATILGARFIPGTVVLCVRVNHQWYAFRPESRPTSLQTIPTGDDAGESALYPAINHFIFPEEVELISTGGNKAELDGFYQLIPRHNGNGGRNDAISHYCIGTDLIRKPGATVRLEAVNALVQYSGGNYHYTLTVSHPSITTTVYTSEATSLTHVYKQSGDATLPDDLWWRFGGFTGSLPMWFDLESDEDAITGLYTLWPGYYSEDLHWNAPNKGYIHGADGSRKTVAYSATFFGGTIGFRIQIAVPSGGALRYDCVLEDWSNENGTKITFTLVSNTSSASVPDSIEVRRPVTGFCRTVKLEDQLT